MANNTYKKRHKQVLCIYCGKVPPIPNKTSCKSCYEKNSQYQKELRAKKKALGICTMCNEPVIEGKTLCNYHLEKIKNRAKDRRKERILKGLCQDCGRFPVIEGYSICENCIIKRNKLEELELHEVLDQNTNQIIKIRSNLKGKKYNGLTVLEYSYKGENNHYWLCQCDCGNIVVVNQLPLITYFKKNCGECGED